MTGRSTIGVLSPFVSGHYFGAIISGVQGAVAEAGVRLLAIQTSDPGVDYSSRSQISPHLHAAAWAHLAGCVVVIDAATPAYLDAIRSSGKPIVMISTQLDGVRSPIVRVDNRSGARDAVRHLIDHGHRKIAFVGRLTRDDIRERYEAYQEALLQAGIEPDPTLVFATFDDEEAAGVLVGEQILAGGLRSTATMAATDGNAIGLIRALTAGGLEIPRDQAVIGFDDVDEAAFMRPALSTVRQDFAAIGALAARLLLDKIAGVVIADGHHEVPAQFIARESCGCTAATVGSTLVPAVPRAAAVRRRQLAERLDRAVGPEADERGRAAAVADACSLIAHTLEAAAEDHVGPVGAPVREALEVFYGHAPRSSTVRSVIDAAHEFACDLVLPRSADSAAAAARVADQVLGLKTTLASIHSRDQFAANAHLKVSLVTQYAVAMDLLRSHEEDPRSLAWLGRTSVRRGCLGLWSDAPSESGRDADPTLAVVGSFDRTVVTGAASALSCLNQTIAASSFPPARLLALADEYADDVVFLVPVKVGLSDWGLLSVVGQIDSKTASGRETLNQWVALLTVALDYQENVASLKEQREKVERSYERELGLVEDIRLSEERYALAAQAANDGLWDWDLAKGDVFYSSRWKTLLGYGAEDIGSTADDWFGRVHPEDLDTLLRAIDEHIAGRSDGVELEHRMRRADDSYLWVLCRGLVRRGTDGAPTRMVGSLTDVHMRKELEGQLRHAALYDALTGLPNRTLFLDRLRQAMARASRSADYQFAVLFLDLDDFKLVNDSLGHLLGNALLGSIAERISAGLRAADTASRFGGDEFAILLEDTANNHDPVVVAARLQELLAQPIHIGGHEIVVTASVGIASSVTGYASAEDVLRDADTAMYRAKGHEKGTCATFDDDMHVHAVGRLRIEGELRQAVERGQLRLHYQPIVGIHSGRTVSFEALVRWQHPTRGLLDPGEFLSIAEETGLIVPIGRWVFAETCRQIAEWRDCGAPKDLRVGVNVSNRQFWHGGLIDDLRRCLQDNGLEPRNLAVEITETMVMRNVDLAETLLTELVADGFALHIDDFGTGYSSLQALHRFPIAALKVDRSFVQRLGSDPRSTELVRTIAMMARNLGVDVIAEGIETADQRQRIERLGCAYGQGYLFSRPVPGDVAAGFVCREDREVSAARSRRPAAL
jgi:diguanylate cyclase (GGDEF)-like protein/PAS domain S-box-containing protein